jgi:hypothetical protein
MDLIRLLATYFFVVALYSSCGGSGQSNVDAFTGQEASDDFSAFGNSSISFAPVPWDYGTLTIGNTSVVQEITAQNISSRDLYISSISVASSHFIKVSDNCPIFPNQFNKQDTCEILVKFAPTSVGSLAASININFGDSSTSISTYTSSGSVIGTAVTPLTFTGLDSVCGKTHNTFTLCWTADSSATVYQIFDVSNGSMVWIKNVDNSSGTANSTTITGLTPSTLYTYRVRAIDGTGQSEGKNPSSL